MTLLVGLVSILAILVLALGSHLCFVGAEVPPKYRIDCAPAGPLDEEACLKRGCLWSPATLPAQPSCYYKPDFNCYHIKRRPTGSSRVEQWLLERRTSCPSSGFPGEASQLELRVSRHSETTINIKIVEPNKWRHEPRLPQIRHTDLREHHKDPFGEFKVELSTDSSRLMILHRATGTSLLEIELFKLIYSERFIQLTTYLPSSFLYGLGQHMGRSLLKSNTSEYQSSYTMFNYGHPPAEDGKHAYSSYPFYMNLVKLQNRKTSDRQFIMVGGLMLNSNAMDVLHHNRKAEEDLASALTWRPVGGIVDLYLFAGPHPHEVIYQYQRLVGEPTVPPAWALGYHQSRLNYRELIQIKLAWARTRELGIPVETLWTDIDFLSRHTSYSVSDPLLGDFVKVLHEQFDMHYVPIVDSAISIFEEPNEYPPLKLAIGMDLFATYPQNDSQIALVNQWMDSKHGAILDVTNPHMVSYLNYVLTHYHDQLNFDGLWLDMNEPEVFYNHLKGEDGRECPYDEQLPYLPGSRNLNERTLCMAAEFNAGRHFDIHNIYSFYQAKTHYEALRLVKPNKRPFIVSRSQFPGQGRYGGTWLGDLGSTFEHLRWSIIGTIESNWFGQPFVGADICGFFGAAEDELCARWYSVGSFYPFARNHNGHPVRDQDPAVMGPAVQRAALTTLMRRYSLLPYLYTQFYRNHLEAQPVIRSMLFEFMDRFWRLPWPLDNINLSDLPQIDDQMMFGPALMIAPVVQADATSRNVYLAPGRWYDVSLGLAGTLVDPTQKFDYLVSNRPLVEPAPENLDEREQGRLDGLYKPYDCALPLGCKLVDLYSPLGSTNIYLRGGTTVPIYRFVDSKNSVGKLWNDPFFLEIALNETDESFGSLYWDSGESQPEEERHNLANFYVTHNRLQISLLIDRYSDVMRFDGFMVYGLKEFTNSKPTSQNGVRLKFNYDQARMTLSCVFLKQEEDEIQTVEVMKNRKLVFEW